MNLLTWEEDEDFFGNTIYSAESSIDLNDKGHKAQYCFAAEVRNNELVWVDDSSPGLHENDEELISKSVEGAKQKCERRERQLVDLLEKNQKRKGN